MPRLAAGQFDCGAWAVPGCQGTYSHLAWLLVGSSGRSCGLDSLAVQLSAQPPWS